LSKDLIRRVASEPSNQSLWVDLYNKLRPAVFYAAYRVCRGNRDIAADLTQAAFERLIRYANLGRFRSDVQLAAYLRQIVMRLAFDELRREASSESLESSDAEVLKNAWTVDDTDIRDTESDLRQLAEDLAEADRALLSRLLAGKSLSEIAEDAGISYNAAAVRVHRLKDKISNKYS
jgi:RNA polymerase sigma factor (sigma-70 family)